MLYKKWLNCVQIISIKNNYLYNCLQKFIISYLKSYNWMQIISIRWKYLKLYNCV